jgi:hypothetical protein
MTCTSTACGLSAAATIVERARAAAERAPNPTTARLARARRMERRRTHRVVDQRASFAAAGRYEGRIDFVKLRELRGGDAQHTAAQFGVVNRRM